MSGVRVTAVGAWPGTNVHDATSLMRDMCVGLLHLPELPDRGPGADMIGRTMGLLSSVANDFAVETVPTGWRMTAARGRDMRRADAFIGEDLDKAEELCTGYDGDFKIQIIGPWSLAASVENRSGEKLLRDSGAVRDLAGALGHTIESYVADVQRRLPLATVILEIDEPYVTDVLRGSVKTQSGWSAHSPVEPVIVEDTLQRVREHHDGQSVIHCCADEVPFDLFRKAGFTAPSWDVALVGPSAADHIGEQIDAGGFVILGLEPSSVKAGVDTVVKLGNRVGYQDAEWNSHIVLSPPCDLIDMSLSQARERMETLNKVAKALAQEDS